MDYQRLVLINMIMTLYLRGSLDYRKNTYGKFELKDSFIDSLSNQSDLEI